MDGFVSKYNGCEICTKTIRKKGVVEKTMVMQNVQTLVRWTVVACRNALYLKVVFLLGSR